MKTLFAILIVLGLAGCGRTERERMLLEISDLQVALQKAESKVQQLETKLANKSAGPQGARTIPVQVPKLVEQLVAAGFKLTQKEGTNFILSEDDSRCNVAIKSFDGDRPWTIYIECDLSGVDPAQAVTRRKVLTATTRLVSSDVDVDEKDIEALLKSAELLKEGNVMSLQTFSKCEIHTFQIDNDVTVVIRPPNDPFD